MSGGKSIREKKAEYFDKLVKLLNDYSKILLVTCDNIGSHHMQRIRRSLRGQAVMLMGKNTMMRRAIRLNSGQNPKWEGLLPYITYNLGLIFTNSDLHEIKKTVLASKVPAPAKVGAVAPNSVVIPKGMTTLEPTKTAFLQALNIATKINRGNIEILQDVNLIKEGDKVGSSEAALLQMLDIRPFEYGLRITAVYDDGAIYSPKVLDMTDDDIVARFGAGLRNVASLSLEIGFPTYAALPHAVTAAFKNILAVGLEVDGVEFAQLDKIKKILANPSAFAAPAAAAPAASAAPAKEEKPVEKEESDAGVEFDLFG
eukprot:TRINITY_DN9625_c0_g1_i1.p1 TRINITY_DN9625_c0_g1~~TRINITY_DN9625_c0_g1_i1.p1  ORF type:complete len:314 (-),score=92.61 TRINITY_DN9625_c0_g1_i1:79-1020(-)